MTFRFNFLMLISVLAGINQKCIGRSFGDSLNYISLDKIDIGGHLGNKIDWCIQNRIVEQSVDELIEPFNYKNETRWWQTEFWGKWITSAISAYQYQPTVALKEKIDLAVKKLLQTQMPDGYIGNYADAAHLQQWDIWGRKYVLLGLLSYFDLTKDKNTLQAARKLADHLMTEIGPLKKNIVETGNFRGMPSSSILEPMVLLYNRTGDRKYLDFATYIVDQWETPRGPQLISKALNDIPVAQRFPMPKSWWSWDNGSKAYEMMSCYEGLLELYRVTKEPSYLKAVENSVKNILLTEINIAGSGSSFECWYHGAARQTLPTYHTMETCVTVTWMKLCLSLLQTTGDPLYADAIEQSAYNALLSSITPDASSFSKYSPMEGIRSLGEDQCGMNINCCTANGPRGMMLIPKFAVQSSSDGVYINLFANLHSRVSVNDRVDVQIEQSTNYPVTASTEIKIIPDTEASFTVYIRIPSWSKLTTVKVNEIIVEQVIPGQYLPITRKWRRGDHIVVNFDMRGRLADSEFHAAVLRGPIVLARDSRFHDGYVDEVGLVMNQDGFVDLLPVPTQPEGMWMSYSTKMRKGTNLEINDGDETILLCDYSSAGNTWTADSRYKVWLPYPVNMMKNPFKD